MGTDEVDLAARVAELADRDEIARLPRRYARGVDRRDWALVRSCFAAHAVVQGTQTAAPLDPYLEALRPGVERYPSTMHFMGNQLVEMDGERPQVETYAIALHWAGLPAGSPHPENLVMGVRYLDTVERIDGSWKIAHRQVSADWQRGPLPGA